MRLSTSLCLSAVNMAEIIRVTSEALQAQIRNLLPSQQGFGEDLQASNVIMPIIDLTPAGEGSTLRQDLQTAWDFATDHNEINNSTATLVNTPGFYKVELTMVGKIGTSASREAKLSINDGTTNQIIWQVSEAQSTTPEYGYFMSNVMTVFLRSGDSLLGQSTFNELTMNVWTRQIADVNGNFTQPLGFSTQ